jgi:adenine phosphoribosyltransferase
METLAKELQGKIRDIPDFPVKGILFRDITPLLRDAESFRKAVDAIASHFTGFGIEIIASIEARGYILGGALAYRLGAGFVPVRKPGKLPAEKFSETYSLEYGTGVLEIHQDAIKPGQKVLVVDDLIATGGSALAAKNLVEKAGGKVAGFSFLIELSDLKGREALKGHEVFSLIRY